MIFFFLSRAFLSADKRGTELVLLQIITSICSDAVGTVAA